MAERTAGRHRWRVASATAELASQLPEHVVGAVERQIGARSDPRVLFQRWEASRWSVRDIDLSADVVASESATGVGSRDYVASLVDKLTLGEYTAVDHLPSLMLGAPDEDSLIYLGSQHADEGQHWLFISRLAEELLGRDPDARSALKSAWNLAPTALRALFAYEAALEEQVRLSPTRDHETWLRLVTVFHLVTEGIIATTGQRNILRALKRRPELAGLRAGFTGLARDEGRHVAFGMHAVRAGLQDGYEDAIWGTFEEVVPIAVAIDVRPGMSRVQRRLALGYGQELLNTTKLRLCNLGADASTAEHILACGRAGLSDALSAADNNGGIYGS